MHLIVKLSSWIRAENGRSRTDHLFKWGNTASVFLLFLVQIVGLFKDTFHYTFVIIVIFFVGGDKVFKMFRDFPLKLLLVVRVVLEVYVVAGLTAVKGLVCAAVAPPFVVAAAASSMISRLATIEVREMVRIKDTLRDGSCRGSKACRPLAPAFFGRSGCDDWDGGGRGGQTVACDSKAATEGVSEGVDKGSAVAVPVWAADVSIWILKKKEEWLL